MTIMSYITSEYVKGFIRFSHNHNLLSHITEFLLLDSVFFDTFEYN